MSYHPDIHRRRSIRLQGYDYSKEGLYFITICTKDRLCIFGEIKENQMILNELGKVAHKCWMGIPGHFPDVFLHEFIIMPNHVHGIIEIRPDYAQVVGVQNFEPLQPKINQYQKIIPRSIGPIVRGFKIGVTKSYRENTFPISLPQNQLWLRNYHEHIIRNEQSYNTISNYICNNPLNWKEDKFYM